MAPLDWVIAPVLAFCSKLLVRTPSKLRLWTGAGSAAATMAFAIVTAAGDRLTTVLETERVIVLAGAGGGAATGAGLTLLLTTRRVKLTDTLMGKTSD